MRKRRALPLIAVALLALIPTAARAHPRIDAALAAYAEADIDRAREELDAAVELGNLTRDDYMQMLVLRALIAGAGQDEAARDMALRQLASIAPDVELPAEAPPSFRARFDAVRTALAGDRVEGVLEVTREESRFTAHLSLHDPAGVVDTTRMICRAGAEVFQADGAHVFGMVPEWRTIECAAQLLGRGGTVLDERRRSLEATEAPPAGTCVDGECTEDGGDDGLAVGLSIAGALIAAGVAVLVTFLVLDAQPLELREPGWFVAD